MIFRKSVSIFEIFLLVASIVAFTHFTVSALALDESNPLGLGTQENQVSTCVESLDNSACQQYPKDSCDSFCSGSCVEGERTGVEECTEGVCIDDDEGICTSGATKQRCEERDGRFVEGSVDNIAECERHCCILGNEAQFVTEKRCEILSRENGIQKDFDTTIYSADICSLFAKSSAQGACTTPSEKEGIFSCTFTTLGQCLEKTGNKNSFHEGFLCSNPKLHTNCQRQNSTRCSGGLDGVYYFDSCGNKENIFFSDRDKSWNEGMVLPVEQSCLIGSPDKPLENQANCGNCNHLLGSVCGEEKESQELNDQPDSGFVCKDLGCDDRGTRRENGETWCEYNSNFGPSVDVPFLGALATYANLPIGDFGLHAMASPGSEQYRKSCLNGEIVTEPCGPYRNGVCIESREKVSDSGKQVSVASCIPNRWAECLNYNSNGDSALGKLTNSISQLASIPGIGPAIGKTLALPTEVQKAKVISTMLTCEQDPDCFVKGVSVSKDFKFPMCVPKYPPGFYKKQMDQNDAGICSYGSQTCASVWVLESTPFTFGAATKWTCKANCECVDGNDPDSVTPSKKFIDQMHGLCISLGDCGMKANYEGDVGGAGQGYKLKKSVYKGMPTTNKNHQKTTTYGSPPFPTDDSKPVKGKYIDAKEYQNFRGGDYGLGNSSGNSAESGTNGGSDRPINTPLHAHYTPPNTLGPSLAFTGVLGAGALGTMIATHYGFSIVATTATPYIVGGTMTDVFASTVVSSGLTGSEAAAAAPGFAADYGAGVQVGIVPPTGLLAFQAGLTGAAIGVAIVSILIGISGIGRGIGTGGTIAYMVSSVAAGGAIGVSVAAGGWGSLVGAGTASSSAGFTAPVWLGPVGLAFAVIIIADIIAQWIAGVGQIKTTEVSFECLPWTAPATSKCDQCGKNGFPCDKYNCETLGHNCEFLPQNEGSTDEDLPSCVSVEFNDVSAPKIVKLLDDTLTTGFSYENVDGLNSSSTHFTIHKNSADGCVNQFEKIYYGFSLDEPGECKYSFEPDTKFDEMYDVGAGGLRYDHRDSLGDLWDRIDPNKEKSQEVTVYIRCKDYQLDENHGGTISNANSFNFCVNPLDLTAPLVIDTNIKEGYIAPYSQNTTILIITFDETVDGARLDVSDKEYLDMQYGGQCADNVCYFEIPLNLGDNSFYVRAIDKSGNVMQQGSRIDIPRSEHELSIDSITHDGTDLHNKTITRGALLTAVKMTVETSGGVDGTADCSYGLEGGGEALFEVTGNGKKHTHTQELTSLLPGIHTIGIGCVDRAGDSAFDSVTFMIDADIFVPSVTRVYDDSGRLVLVTNEEATCGYSHENCEFEISESQIMDGTDLVHQTTLDNSAPYYIKCKDKFDNEPRTCNTIVKAGEFR